MEKNIKIITRKLNSIGSSIGYPFYIYGDGSYSAKPKDGEVAVVTVACPLQQINLKENKPVYASVAEKYTPALANAQTLDYLYEDGTISPRRTNFPVTGIIGWKNPDANAPLGKRALCFSFYGWKYEDFMSKEDFSSANTLSKGGILSPSGSENTDKLLELADTAGLTFLAAEHARNLTGQGLQKGDCFLLSEAEAKLIAPVFEDIVNRIETLDFGTSEKVLNRRFGLNSNSLKNFIFTSTLHDPNKIECYMHNPAQPGGKFYDRDLNTSACIAPAFWI